eukprot:scaffold2872_cov112-Isochrysis_galbana.AAC.10
MPPATERRQRPRRCRPAVRRQSPSLLLLRVRPLELSLLHRLRLCVTAHEGERRAVPAMHEVGMHVAAGGGGWHVRGCRRNRSGGRARLSSAAATHPRRRSSARATLSSEPFLRPDPATRRNRPRCSRRRPRRREPPPRTLRRSSPAPRACGSGVHHPSCRHPPAAAASAWLPAAAGSSAGLPWGLAHGPRAQRCSETPFCTAIEPNEGSAASWNPSVLG